jgi:hypothetical protein
MVVIVCWTRHANVFVFDRMVRTTKLSASCGKFIDFESKFLESNMNSYHDLSYVVLFTLLRQVHGITLFHDHSSVGIRMNHRISIKYHLLSITNKNYRQENDWKTSLIARVYARALYVTIA